MRMVRLFKVVICFVGWCLEKWTQKLLAEARLSQSLVDFSATKIWVGSEQPYIFRRKIYEFQHSHRDMTKCVSGLCGWVGVCVCLCIFVLSLCAPANLNIVERWLFLPCLFSSRESFFGYTFGFGRQWNLAEDQRKKNGRSVLRSWYGCALMLMKCFEQDVQMHLHLICVALVLDYSKFGWNECWIVCFVQKNHQTVCSPVGRIFFYGIQCRHRWRHNISNMLVPPFVNFRSQVY